MYVLVIYNFLWFEINYDKNKDNSIKYKWFWNFIFWEKHLWTSNTKFCKLKCLFGDSLINGETKMVHQLCIASSPSALIGLLNIYWLWYSKRYCMDLLASLLMVPLMFLLPVTFYFATHTHPPPRELFYLLCSRWCRVRREGSYMYWNLYTNKKPVSTTT